jgi:hypothetical protein
MYLTSLGHINTNMPIEGNSKRQFITSISYAVGEEIAATPLSFMLAKETKRLKEAGWSDIMLSIRHDGKNMNVRYTGIRS